MPDLQYMCNMDWAEKYRPQHLDEILGNAAAVKQMALWAQTWTADSAPLLLIGKPGIGKTSAALALARDMNWEVLELNASDARTKAVIERIAGNSASTASLFGASRKMVIIDEADNLEGNADRGGARAIADLLKTAKQPVLLIANDAYGVSDSIRRICETVQFRSITSSTLAKRMKEICVLEHVSCSEDALSEIAGSAAGDMRSAVNMLFGSAAGLDSLSADGVSTAQKDERATIFDLVAAVATGTSDERLMKLSRECEEKPDYVVQWVEEAVSQIPDRKRKIRAYRRVSKADVYLGRTMTRQYYTLWRYATALMTIGVASEEESAGFRPRVMPPSRWKRMATAKKQKTVRRTLSAALAEGYSIPDIQVQSEYIDLLSWVAEADPEAFCERHNLDADQLTVLLHDKTRAAAAFKAVQKAAKEKEIKVKKAAAAKKAEARKKADLEEALRKAEEEAAKEAVKEPVVDPVVEEEKPVEKKPAATQATLDFF